MKILVIFTGGTIGSAVKSGWISTDDSTSYLLLDRYLAENGDGISFDTLSPYSVLSENISADNLTELLDCVSKNLDKDYDGIIVTHGTDTIQYTAAALGFAFGNTLPMVLVSSNLPLDDPDTNGHVNFAAAVDLVRAGEKGVFAVYRNNDGVIYAHHSSRLLRHTEANDDLYSLSACYGICKDSGFVKNPDFVGSDCSKPCGAVRFSQNSGVLSIICRPGDCFSYSLEGVRAVLLQPYHSGTLYTTDGAFAELCKKAAELQIPVFVSNVPGGVRYSSSKLFDDLGIIPLPFCASIPVYMKLWMALSLGADPKEFAASPLYEEFM